MAHIPFTATTWQYIGGVTTLLIATHQGALKVYPGKQSKQSPVTMLYIRHQRFAGRQTPEAR